MRLDIYLKTSRLIARRSLAQKFCDAGFIKVNNLTAKSSREVKPDDELEIKNHNRLIKIRVSQLPDKKQVAKHEATNLYEVISEEILEDEL